MIDRRSLITGLISFVAAPAIVRVTNLMPVKIMLAPPYRVDIPGTDMALQSEFRHIVDGWSVVFERGREHFSPGFMQMLMRGPWEYVPSPLSTWPAPRSPQENA